MSERDDIAQAMLSAQLERNPAQPPESWNRGVRNVTTGVLGGIADLPRQAIGAAQHYTDTGEYNPAPVMDTAMTAMTGGLPMAAKGAAGIFGGRLSMSADLPKLMKAEDMALAKAPAKQIWNETGWVQRPDRQWRYEIPDDSAAFNQTYLSRLRHGDRDALGEVFRHPALYEAYPEAKGMAFGHSAQLPKGVRGYFQPEHQTPINLREVLAGKKPETVPPELVINATQSGSDKVSTVLHELQHIVQGKEGFAMGGAPASAINRGTPVYEVYKDLRRTFDPKRLEKMSLQKFSDTIGDRSGSMTKDTMDAFVNTMRQPGGREAAAEHFAKTEAYRRLLGESEARLVQDRGTMSALARRDTFPALDVPEKKLIIRTRPDAPW